MENSEELREIPEKLPEVMIEKDLEAFFDMSREQIGNLRRSKKLPFVKMTNRNRVYLRDDLMEWFRANRMVLNKDL